MLIYYQEGLKRWPFNLLLSIGGICNCGPIRYAARLTTKLTTTAPESGRHLAMGQAAES
jgi:hypothetical protein